MRVFVRDFFGGRNTTVHESLESLLEVTRHYMMSRIHQTFRQFTAAFFSGMACKGEVEFIDEVK